MVEGGNSRALGLAGDSLSASPGKKGNTRMDAIPAGQGPRKENQREGESMKGKISLLMAAIACCSLLLISCSSEKPAPAASGGSSVDQILKASSSGKTMKAVDGSCEITVPENWTEEKDLNKDAKLQTANRIRDVYIVVFVDQKDKYGDIQLAEFAEGAQKKLAKRLTTPKIAAPVQLTIGELPAIQYEITGAAGGSTFIYHQTLIQGPRNFYEIL